MKIINATSLSKLSLVSLISVLLFVFLTGCSDNAVSTSGKSISISAVKETVWEGDTAVFRILLSEPNKTGSDLKVFFTFSGSAVEGSDYDSIYNGGFILIPKDSQSVYIRTEINHDSLLEATESLTINLTGSDGGEYNTGLSNSETVVLMDGDGPTVTDIDGNVYHTVLIGTQTWMVENLKTTRYRNGNAVGDHCWKIVEDYGRLYDWSAVTNPMGLAPSGWHIPTDEEWTSLVNYLGGELVAGKKMKSTSGWFENGNGTNESGFTAFPGGLRYFNGFFYYIGKFGYFWSATEVNSGSAWNRNLYYGLSVVYRNSSDKGCGFSIRCVRDETCSASQIIIKSVQK